MTEGITSNFDQHDLDQSEDSDPECTRKVAEVEDEVLAKTETKAVWCLRLTFFSMLGAVATSVCLMVFFLARASEQEDFRQDFTDIGIKLVDSFQESFRTRLGIYEDFSEGISSFMRDTNNTWPFALIPDYERRAGRTARLADVMSIVLCPLVEEDEKNKWHTFADDNQAWKAEGIALQQGLAAEEVEVDPIVPFIFKLDVDGNPVPDAGPGPYFPTWQVYPAVPYNFQNINLLSHPEYTLPLQALLDSKNFILPPSYDFWGLNSTDLRRALFNQYLETYEEGGLKYEDDPVLPLLHPVFDRPDGDRKVTAVLLSAVYWRTYFRRLLLPGASGITVVLENTCDQQYTYRVDGEEAFFIGHGDLSDHKYKYLEVLTSYEDLKSSKASEAFAMADCLYRIRVSPSQEFLDSHTTHHLLVYAISLAVVFLLTSCVLVLYDYCVERRQRLVLKTATQADSLVSSLFPKAVRNRLYEEQEAKQSEKISRHKDWRSSPDLGNDSSTEKSDMIANLYENSTVLFADIAGFTKWSSHRTPIQVFDLLETVFGAFDDIAIRRQVFKIETVGDCYVATTGLPDAQPDHAVIMARFATDCLNKLNEILHGDLLHRLGPDTVDLAMRFGFHSGPTTAGVLRGEKSRFQIFGDTVNTAARMESTGICGKIQVSETSAQLLIQAGKSHWVAPRDNLVHAKGKGEMRTYWVTVAPNTSIIMSDTTIP